MIELEAFSKSYSSKYSSKKDDFSVKNISLKVPKGTITGLIGPNGSGKTTIMKAICGFHYPTSGKIILTGEAGEGEKQSNAAEGNLSEKNLSEKGQSEKTRSAYAESMVDLTENPEKAMNLVGYVPELPALPPEMPVSTFLNYAAACHGLSPDQAEKSLEKVTKQCSLEKFLQKKIKSLSKGQKQRVSFAQALIYDPPNLILDEPISGLDPAQIIQMRNLIQELSKNKAILMSTHILQEIYSLCSNLYILNEGQLVAQGSEEEIIKQNKVKSLEEAFIKLTSTSDE